MTKTTQTVQLLIERGCQYAARNNQGFTASDYAYSFVLYSIVSVLVLNHSILVLVLKTPFRTQPGCNLRIIRNSVEIYLHRLLQEEMNGEASFQTPHPLFLRKTTE
jgi:hypothetical protein